jgi:hypothetical protein
MAKRRKPQLGVARPLGAKAKLGRPENLRIPWLHLLRVAALAVLGVSAAGWAVDRSLHAKRRPMLVPVTTSAAWPPPSTIDVTDVDLTALPEGAPLTSAAPAASSGALGARPGASTSAGPAPAPNSSPGAAPR